MRINIDTGKFPIRDKDIRALYIIQFALSIIERRMIVPTLQYFADRHGYRLEPKP